MKKIVLLLIMSMTYLWGESEFLQGNLYYSEKNFEKAIESYEEDIKINGDSFNTYYNMAGAWLSLDRPGPALLSCEKASIINPSDGDLKLKIESLREKYSLEEDHTGLISRAARSMAPVTWFVISTTGMLLAALLFLIFTLLKNKKEFLVMRFYKIAMAISLMLFVLGGLMTGYYLTEKNQAVILMETSVRVSPYTNAEESFTLKEGIKVNIKESWEDFYFIEDNSKRYGWVHKNEAGKIWNE